MEELNNNEKHKVEPSTPEVQLPETPPTQTTNQYWSSQDSKQAQPQQRQQMGYRPYGSQNRPPQQSYDSYSHRQNNQGYPNNSGWQNPQQNDRNEWNFNDYDKFSKDSKNKKASRGIVIFTVSILSVLLVSLISISGIYVYRSLIEDDNILISSSSEISESSANSNAVDEPDGAKDDGAELSLSDKPKVSEPQVQVEGARLTTPQVADKLLPSIISVENFQNGDFFQAYGLGSGIIMSNDGYIITNHHVVALAEALRVTLNTGETYMAELVGSDERTDLAVIKIDTKDLLPAEFGDSTQLSVGEPAIAIGNPASLELQGSVTKGIISALNRVVHTNSYDMTFIQTDAAINPGNSGGALVNEFGQIIGINSSKISAEGFEGIGFAIPISDAKPIIDDLMKYGRVKGRVMLGITAKPIDEITARDNDVPMGLMVYEINASSDLMKKGVQVRDIITHLNGTRIYTFDELRLELNNHKVGDTITMSLYRQKSTEKGGRSFDVSITLVEDVG